MPELISPLSPQGIELQQRQMDIKAQADRRKEFAAMQKFRGQEMDLKLREMDMSSKQFDDQMRDKEIQRQTMQQMAQKDRDFAAEQGELTRGAQSETQQNQIEATKARDKQLHDNNVKTMELQAGHLKTAKQEERDFADKLRREAAADANELQKITDEYGTKIALMEADIAAATIASVNDEEKAGRMAHKMLGDLASGLTSRLTTQQAVHARWSDVSGRIAAQLGGNLSGLLVDLGGPTTAIVGRRRADLQGSQIPFQAFMKAALKDRGMDETSINTEAYEEARNAYEQYVDDPSQAIKSNRLAAMLNEGFISSSGWTPSREATTGYGEWVREKRGAAAHNPEIVAHNMLNVALYEWRNSMKPEDRKMTEGWDELATQVLGRVVNGQEGIDQVIDQTLRATGSSAMFSDFLAGYAEMMNGVASGTVALPSGEKKGTGYAQLRAAARGANNITQKLGIALDSASGTVESAKQMATLITKLKNNLEADMGPEQVELFLSTLPPAEQRLFDEIIPGIMSRALTGQMDASKAKIRGKDRELILLEAEQQAARRTQTQKVLDRQNAAATP